MNPRSSFRAATSAVVALLALPAVVFAQTAEDFDEGRAMLSDAPMFDAFYPTTYGSLAELRRSGRVGDDTAVLALHRGTAVLTLLTMQMSYHHVAQGELRGEPWMVSF